VDIPVEDPVLDIAVRVVGAVGGALPVALHLGEEAVLVLLSALLRLVALRREPVRQLVGIPAVVRLHNIIIPVLLDEVLQVLATAIKYGMDPRLFPRSAERPAAFQFVNRRVCPVAEFEAFENAIKLGQQARDKGWSEDKLKERFKLFLAFGCDSLNPARPAWW